MRRGIVVFGLVAVLGGCADVTDAIAGRQGQNCVAVDKRPGDAVIAPDRHIHMVEKLEGSSYRCPEDFPIRAVLK